MDDLRSQISFKGLTEGYQATPLRKFKGILREYVPEKDQKYDRLNVKFHFDEVEVIRAVTPYDFPTAELQIPHSTRKGSRWGILAGSVQTLLGTEGDVDQLVGKKQTWELTQGHPLYDARANNGAGADVPQDAWEVVEVEGAGSSNGAAGMSPLKSALVIARGKTEQEFNTAALRDQEVKKDPALVQSLLSKTFIPSNIQAGLLAKGPDGRLQVSDEVLAAL